MRMNRFYQSIALSAGSTVLLNESASRHAGRVLRLPLKSTVILFNGDGYDYAAEIVSKNSRNLLSAVITEKRQVNMHPRLHIHLIQALSRPEKMDWVIQKAVELGAAEITPVITSYCGANNQKIKHERWQNIIISAAEQSGRADLPILHPASTLESFLDNINTADQNNFVFHPAAVQTLKNIFNQSLAKFAYKNFNILIGPEGGLSSREIIHCQEKNFLPVKLGNRILRTETAPIAAISAIHALWGDFS